MPVSRSPSAFIRTKMDKLRRSIRQSFSRRGSKDSVEEAAKPHQWQKDEASVRAGTCSFIVKYLGCVEVFESRGMQVCEEALKALRSSRRRTVKGVLHVSGDGLRVVDAESKGLIVDQTIEKVSFCAPDRNNEKGFAYISRDGTTRRWICHGFHASKDSGERLSHAVGCAFAVCLQQKQKRDREGAQLQPMQTVSGLGEQTNPSDLNSDSVSLTPTFTNRIQGSFRRASLAERKQDPQNVIPTEKPPVRPTFHPDAVARPEPNRSLFQRQGSLRMPASTYSQPSTSVSARTPFSRYGSLRMPQASLESTPRPSFMNNGPSKGVSAIWESDEDTLAELSTNFSRAFANPSNSSFAIKAHSFDYTFASPNGNDFGNISLRSSEFDTCDGHMPASNTPSSASCHAAKSRGERWLQNAANQAKLLQLQRQTPPSNALPGAVSPVQLLDDPINNNGNYYQTLLKSTDYNNEPNRSVFDGQVQLSWTDYDNERNRSIFGRDGDVTILGRDDVSVVNDARFVYNGLASASATFACSSNDGAVFPAASGANSARSDLSDDRRAFAKENASPKRSDATRDRDATALQSPPPPSSSFDEKWALLSNPFTHQSSEVDV